MCSMLGCALIPRLSLVAAIGERRGLLGRPIALAPEPGAPQAIDEVSGAAEAFGVLPGMRLAEALARCPSLVLVPPDPARAEAIGEKALRDLEGIGAAVEPGRPGEAFFGLRPLHELHGPPWAALAKARSRLGRTARLGAGPSRLCAYAAALRGRAHRAPPIVSEAEAGRFLSGLPIDILRDRLAGEWERRAGRPATSAGAQAPPTDRPSGSPVAEEVAAIDSLERLGVRTLGELASLPAQALADRFGEPGLRALRIARGDDEPLRPRRPPPQLLERLALPEAASGPHLERALQLLVGRLLAHPARLGRSFRRLRLEAPLEGGGSWRADATLRSATADPERLRLALAPKLERLPGAVRGLALRALEMAPGSGEQPPLARSPAEERRRRLGEAVRQARAVAGRDALLRVVEVDPCSRLPERRALLAPFPEPGS
jgi:protein ImuB